MERLTVEVEEDHLAKLVHPTNPTAGIMELIWNALDADADHVAVVFSENGLGGLTSVRVVDDGDGVSPEDAREVFKHLGGSWKREASRTKTKNRSLHGSEGRGRWRAFAIGDRVTWQTVAEVNGERHKSVISGRATALREFEITDPARTEDETGTTVQIDDLPQQERGLRTDRTTNKMLTTFALHLSQYPDVEISYDGTTLDPAPLVRHRADYELCDTDYGPATLTVIEWYGMDDRALYLCDEDGSTLGETKPGIHAPGFDFTAYVKWQAFHDLVHEIPLVDSGHQILGPVVDAARDRLRAHFRERGSELTRSLIDEWKADEVYPFVGEPTTPVEAAERDLFDVVALAAARTVNAAEDVRSRKLTLRLLREALDNSPAALEHVLLEVLELPAERLEELSALLERSPLTSMIAATKVVTNRLDFLRGLEVLVFDPEVHGKVLERRHLHRILAAEPWVFGEEYAVSADDESLTTVLKRHIELMERNDLAPLEEVLDEQGRRMIVDLLLARSVEHNHNFREHLVVELKRPSVVAGAKEIEQIKRYAFAVAADPRFHGADVRWDFVLVTAEWDSYADNEVAQSQQRVHPGLIHDGLNGVRIWLKKWSQVIEECEHRLKFVRSNLGYSPDTDAALQYLRETHSKYLPPVMAEEGETAG